MEYRDRKLSSLIFEIFRKRTFFTLQFWNKCQHSLYLTNQCLPFPLVVETCETFFFRILRKGDALVVETPLNLFLRNKLGCLTLG